MIAARATGTLKAMRSRFAVLIAVAIAADGAVLRQHLGGYIWPIPPVPRAIAGGATLRLLPSGEIQWHFEGAPEFGTGTVGILGGPP